VRSAEAADVILVFDDGQIIEQGSHGELVESGGRYATLYDAWTRQQQAQNGT